MALRWLRKSPIDIRSFRSCLPAATATWRKRPHRSFASCASRSRCTPWKRLSGKLWSMPARATLMIASCPFRRGPPERANQSAKQALRCEPGAVAQARELCPNHVFRDAPPAGRGVEATVGAGENPLAIADHRGHAFDAIRDHLRVLDKISQAVDHAGNEDLILRAETLKSSEIR